MLLVNVHELEIVLVQPVRLRALEHEVDHVGRVVGLDGQDIFILSGAEHLGQGDEVDAEGDVSVASVRGEGFGEELHRDQRHVGVIHGLEGNAGIIAVKVAVLHEVSDGIDNLEGSVLLGM